MPDDGFVGDDQIVYRLRNALGGSAELTTTLNVIEGANQAPLCIGSTPFVKVRLTRAGRWLLRTGADRSVIAEATFRSQGSRRAVTKTKRLTIHH